MEIGVWKTLSVVIVFIISALQALVAVALGWHGSLAGNLSPWGLAARANHSVSRSVPHLHSSTRNVT